MLTFGFYFTPRAISDPLADAAPAGRLNVEFRGRPVATEMAENAMDDPPRDEFPPEKAEATLETNADVVTMPAIDPNAVVPVNSLLFDPWSEYLPGKELDSRPRPIDGVIVPFPGGRLTGGRGKVTLILYVGVSGSVERVEVDEGSELPLPFIKSAVDAFFGVLMVPGVKDGKNVPSQIKVLVEFEESKPW